MTLHLPVHRFDIAAGPLNEALAQFQKQAGVVKSDFPYDKVVAVQFKSLWDQ